MYVCTDLLRLGLVAVVVVVVVGVGVVVVGEGRVSLTTLLSSLAAGLPSPPWPWWEARERGWMRGRVSPRGEGSPCVSWVGVKEVSWPGNMYDNILARTRCWPGPLPPLRACWEPKG